MAIKGQTSKENLIKELLEYFGDRAFRYDKDLRVNCIEDGQPCQIKLNFTVSKVAVNEGGDTALPGDVPAPLEQAPLGTFNVANPTVVAEPTEQEKHTVAELLKALNL